MSGIAVTTVTLTEEQIAGRLNDLGLDEELIHDLKTTLCGSRSLSALVMGVMKPVAQAIERCKDPEEIHRLLESKRLEIVRRLAGKPNQGEVERIYHEII